MVLNHYFSIGDRVRVSSEYHWARSAAGTVRLPPQEVLELAADWEGHVRHVQMRKGLMPFFWVEFDVPQADADGDGPYQAGEIEGSYLSAT